MSAKSNTNSGSRADLRDGVALGPFLCGHSTLPRRGGNVVLPLSGLPKHVLVTGSPGIGKSCTAA